MGSFNETCALSNLEIPYGTPVRLLFLVQNIYRSGSRNESKRGVHFYDQWVCRTPPLKGVYDDYGRAKLEDSPLIQIICDVFSEDVVERPMGFNYYHDPAVFKGRDLNHYLEAAWEGRLLVEGNPKPEVPPNWPTWVKVSDILKASKMPLQYGVDKGYNAQPVRPGIVAVTFRSFEDTTKQLLRAKDILDAHYDSKVVYKWNNSDGCLIVTVKGAFENPAILSDIQSIERDLKIHPELMIGRDTPPQSVLAVMVREDVWQVFCKIPLSVSIFHKKKRDLETIESEFRDIYQKRCSIRTNQSLDDNEKLKKLWPIDEAELYRSWFGGILQTNIPTHLEHAERKLGIDGIDSVIRPCAELCQVQIVMSQLNRPWYIPPLGGQDPEWNLHSKLLGELQKIAKKNKRGK
jgi:hypothetical protein